MSQKKIIGVIGTISSGKDSVAAYMCGKLGIKNYSLSDEIRYEIFSRGIENTRANQFAVANELRASYGHEELAKRALNRASEDLAIVTSVRYPAELKFFQDNSSFTLISVDAPIELRFQRSLDRGRIGDGTTFEQFKQAEDTELRGKERELQFVECMRKADYFIINDGTLDELYKRTDEVIKAITLTKAS